MDLNEATQKVLLMWENAFDQLTPEQKEVALINSRLFVELNWGKELVNLNSKSPVGPMKEEKEIGEVSPQILELIANNFDRALTEINTNLNYAISKEEPLKK